jgi:hypothetical protein
MLDIKSIKLIERISYMYIYIYLFITLYTLNYKPLVLRLRTKVHPFILTTCYSFLIERVPLNCEILWVMGVRGVREAVASPRNHHQGTCQVCVQPQRSPYWESWETPLRPSEKALSLAYFAIWDTLGDRSVIGGEWSMHCWWDERVSDVMWVRCGCGGSFLTISVAEL